MSQKSILMTLLCSAFFSFGVFFLLTPVSHTFGMWFLGLIFVVWLVVLVLQKGSRISRWIGDFLGASLVFGNSIGVLVGLLVFGGITR